MSHERIEPEVRQAHAILDDVEMFTVAKYCARSNRKSGETRWPAAQPVGEVEWYTIHQKRTKLLWFLHKVTLATNKERTRSML